MQIHSITDIKSMEEVGGAGEGGTSKRDLAPSRLAVKWGRWGDGAHSTVLIIDNLHHFQED